MSPVSNRLSPPSFTKKLLFSTNSRSPVRMINWSPVLTPIRLEPVTIARDEIAPVAATLVGVIAPRVSVIAGVVVGVATEPDTPDAVTTETMLTVPLPDGPTGPGGPAGPGPGAP